MSRRIHTVTKTMSHGMLDFYTVVQKNRTPVTSSNSCIEYDPISVTFGLENRQRVLSLQVSNWRVLMKLDISFVFLHGNNHLQQTTLKWVCAKRQYFNKKSI